MKEVKQPRRPMFYYYMIILIVLLLVNSLLLPYLQDASVSEVTYSQFMKWTEEKKIDEVEIRSTEIYFTLKDSESDSESSPKSDAIQSAAFAQSAAAMFGGLEGKTVYKTGRADDPNLTERLYAAGATFTEDIDSGNSGVGSFAMTLLAWLIPILFFVWIGNRLQKRMMDQEGGAGSMMFGMGKSNAKLYVQSTEGIHFSDVAGEDEAEENLKEIVEYLHNPQKYTAIGATMPKGVLLVGPPGTGKTMLAKAVAGEADVPFFSISGSEFVEMFVGMGASKVRDLFKQAKEKAPCIVFIDEIDAIGKKREGGAIGGNDEREQTLNQLLTEMDGFESNNGVMILAATNRPESLDPALLRPGRFDRRVPVELPDLKGREDILKVHAKKVRIAPDVDFHTIARMAAGASGAELANIVNEAALRAVRNNRNAVTEADLEESIEVVIAGYQRKNAILSDDEKKVVSYHEIGHALVAALQTDSAPVQKITIIPRTSGALGYTMQVDEGQKNLYTKEELLAKLTTFTGGRAAEEVVFGRVTTGASNDIEQATKIARAMITRYGMSDEFDMVAMENVQNQYLGGDTSLACSAEKQAQIDDQVVSTVKMAHAKAKKILEENRDCLDALAKYLYEHETITGEEFMTILNQVRTAAGKQPLAAVETPGTAGAPGTLGMSGTPGMPGTSGAGGTSGTPGAAGGSGDPNAPEAR